LRDLNLRRNGFFDSALGLSSDWESCGVSTFVATEFFDSALALSSCCAGVFTATGGATIFLRVSAAVRCRRLFFLTATVFSDLAIVFEAVRGACSGAKQVQPVKVTARTMVK
jgi:hypothetical protein